MAETKITQTEIKDLIDTYHLATGFVGRKRYDRLVFAAKEFHKKHPDISESKAYRIVDEETRMYNPVKIHPEAIESLKRFKADKLAGHSDAAEYWRGQAGAYFTANPYQLFDSRKPEIRNKVSDYIKNNISAPYVHVSISTLGGYENASAIITVSLDEKSTWHNDIIQNSRYLYFRIDNDGEVENFNKSYKIKKSMRKTKVKTLGDAITKINSYLSEIMSKENPILASVLTGLSTGAGFGVGFLGVKKIGETMGKRGKKNPIHTTAREARKLLFDIHEQSNSMIEFRYGKYGEKYFVGTVEEARHLLYDEPQDTDILFEIVSVGSKEKFKPFYKSSNPFPVKTKSTRKIKNNTYWYAGRTQFWSKMKLEKDRLLDSGIGVAVTVKEGWYLLWTRQPVYVDLSEPIYNPKK